METSLLRSCPSFPKVSFILRTCPISHICHAATYFDSAIRKALETTIGGPVSDWLWFKASLPSSLGGINLRSAFPHAPAAFLASSAQSLPIVERVLHRSPGLGPHSTSTPVSLAVAAARPDWSDLDAPPSSATTLSCDRRGSASTPPLIGSGHPVSCPNPFNRAASCW